MENLSGFQGKKKQQEERLRRLRGKERQYLFSHKSKDDSNWVEDIERCRGERSAEEGR